MSHSDGIRGASTEPLCQALRRTERFRRRRPTLLLRCANLGFAPTSRAMISAPAQYIQLHGRPGGAPMIYLHGTPGSSAEAELISAVAAAHGVELWSVDRARVAPGRTGNDYLEILADVIFKLGAGLHLPILGFSIGAALALRIASRLKAEAGPLYLFSSAGPLDIPGAFAGMGAGASLFRLAQANNARFTLAVRGQALTARHAPGVMARLLFSGADAEDRAFAKTLHARAILSRVFTSAMADRGRSYRRDLETYVQNWSGELDCVSSQVEMWHGAIDTWAPVGMAHAIHRRLPTAKLHVGNAGHYTTFTRQVSAALALAFPNGGFKAEADSRLAPIRDFERHTRQH